MSEEKKKKNKIIGISIGILVVLLVVISSTYAYWQITKSQDGSNDIIAACLDIDMESVDGTFGLNPAWPIRDTEGMNLTGYTFKVTNNCEEDVNYIIGMDSLEVNGVDYLDYNSIKVSIDDSASMIYGDKETIEHIEENDQYTIRTSKKIATSTVRNGQPNEHNVKVWIKSDAPLEEQSKVFSGRMFIIGGQNIEPDPATPEECFVMNGEEIIGYDESCGTSVIIPPTVNGTPVTTIDSDAFKGDVFNYPIVVLADSLGAPLVAYITQPEREEEIKTWAQNNGFGDIEIRMYAGTPTLENEQMLLYCDINKELSNACVVSSEDELTSDYVIIKELDLSFASNLEKIEAGAFSNFERGSEYVNAPEIAEQLATKPVSLTSLKFAKTDKPLIIGWSAFNGIDVGTLEVYTNLVAEKIDTNLMQNDEVYANYVQKNMGNNYFAGAKVKNVIVSSAGLDTIVNEDIFTYLVANQITINEGVTEIGSMAFHGFNRWNLNSKNISLPNSLVKLGKNAFTDIENIVFNSGNCDGIEIESPGWDEDSMVTPNTCQP